MRRPAAAAKSTGLAPCCLSGTGKPILFGSLALRNHLAVREPMTRVEALAMRGAHDMIHARASSPDPTGDQGRRAMPDRRR
jgi:hypothetical protein